MLFSSAINKGNAFFCSIASPVTGAEAVIGQDENDRVTGVYANAGVAEGEIVAL
jgi:hypothetical protein